MAAVFDHEVAVPASLSSKSSSSTNTPEPAEPLALPLSKALLPALSSESGPYNWENPFVTTSCGHPDLEATITSLTNAEATAAAKVAATSSQPVVKVQSEGASRIRSSCFGSSRRTISLLDFDKQEQEIEIDNADHIDNVAVAVPTSGKESPTLVSGPFAEAFFRADWMSRSRTQSDENSSENEAGLRQITSVEIEDEGGSIFSNGGYFDRTDFLASNWTKAMDGPTFGFAVFALATAIAHPVFFVAGALTAFGVVKAAGAGYDCCIDGDELSIDKLLSFKDYPTTTTAITNTTQLVADDKKVESETAIIPIELQQSLKLEPYKQTGDVGPPNVVETTAPIQEIKVGKDSSYPRTTLPTMEVIDCHYPKLEIEVVKDVEFPGLHAFEFFEVFFADDAPFNFLELQKKRGDIDIQYGKWETLPKTVHNLSMYPKENLPKREEIQPRLFQRRILSFKAKTGAIFGPMYATTNKEQRVLIINKRLAIVENKTTLSDIPYCDRFYVLDRWIIKAEKRSGRYVSIVSASTQVIFTKKCQFESQIRSKSSAAIQDLITAWCIMAKEAMKLTEEQKLNRLWEMEINDTDQDSTAHYDENDDFQAGSSQNSELAAGWEGVEIELSHHESAYNSKVDDVDEFSHDKVTVLPPVSVASKRSTFKSAAAHSTSTSPGKKKKVFRRSLLTKYLGGRQ